MKKFLAAIPVIGVVIAMLGASVLAASPEPGIPPVDVIDPDHVITVDDIVIIPGEDLMNVSGKKATDLVSEAEINAALERIGKTGKVEIKDLEVVYTFGCYVKSDWQDYGHHIEIHPMFSHPIEIRAAFNADASDVVLVLHYERDWGGTGGTWYIVGTADTTSTVDFKVNGLSPFAVVKASPASSAQTGEYAGTYLVMVAGALTACGAVFMMRAKKTTR